MKISCLTPIIALLLLSIFSPELSSAQSNFERNKPSFADKLVFGGGFGLQFGTITLVDLSPVVGYRVTERLETGIGISYKYYKVKDYWYDYNSNRSYDLKSNIIGGSVYLRYNILKNVFAHTEFEQLQYRYTQYYNTGTGLTTEKETANISSVFIGGGYRQPISQNSYFFIMALWNLTESSLSPYNNPVLRMGVILGR